jgi:hypothetical protein
MRALAVLTAVAALAATAAAAVGADTRVFELRTYTAAPGRLDTLNARFRDHTLKLFEKHGMTNIGYWTPIDNAENKLIYILAHASRQAADRSWKEFGADPDWQTARKESETKAGGPLTTKVERLYLTATDYSPAVKPTSSSGERVFELRTYTAAPGRLDALNTRFRDHTCKLFEKHGITNVGYWTPIDNAENKLIYMLAHASREAADKSWKAFGADPDWQTARKESETKAGGPLTIRGGVKSQFLKPTDYSPMK